MALSKDEREIVRHGREFQDLVASPAFKLLETLIQRRIRMETQDMLQPNFPEGRDGLLIMKMEDRQKGAIFGMLLTIGLPQSMIDQATELLKREGSAANESEPASGEQINVAKPAP